MAGKNRKPASRHGDRGGDKSPRSPFDMGNARRVRGAVPNYSGAHPLWAFARVDYGGPWCWDRMDGATLLWVLGKLGNFETMTWAEIESAGSHLVRNDSGLSEAGAGQARGNRARRGRHAVFAAPRRPAPHLGNPRGGRPQDHVVGPEARGLSGAEEAHVAGRRGCVRRVPADLNLRPREPREGAWVHGRAHGWSRPNLQIDLTECLASR
jgi:hypothetical protein